MPIANAAGADGKGGQILQVVDFRAGIVNNSTTYGAPYVRVNTIGSPLSLAQVTATSNTVNCIAMGNGGLAPLPQQQPWDMPDTGYSGDYYDPTTGYPRQLLAGLTYTENIFGTSELGLEVPRSIIAAIRTQSAGTGFPLNQLYEYNITTGVWSFVCSDVTEQPANASTGWLSPMFPFVTYWQNIDSPYTTPIYIGMDPTIICTTWAVRVQEHEVSSNKIMAYDMAMDTAIHNGTPFFMTSGGHTGVAFEHQLRTGAWTDIGNGVANLLNYIDPVLTSWNAATNPNRAINPDFNKVFIAFQVNNPSTPGAWGSVTSGDLLVVTNSSGAYIVSGDFFQPSVTYSPGVQPTGGATGQASFTPLGLIYASEDNGVWVWDGGAVAQKISNQLQDNFYYPTRGPAGGSAQNYNQGSFYSSLADGDFIYFSNNWIYCISQGSWWQLGPLVTLDTLTDYPLMWYVTVTDQVNPNVPGGRSHKIYAAPAVFTDTKNTGIGVILDKAIPSQQWTWESNPFLLDDGFDFDITQFWIQLSGSSDASFTVTLTNVTDGSIGYTNNILVSNSGPQWFRFITPMICQSFTVKIVAIDTGDTNVPMICYGFDVIYNTRRPVPVANS
jgi:hypothetical protein